MRGIAKSQNPERRGPAHRSARSTKLPQRPPDRSWCRNRQTTMTPSGCRFAELFPRLRFASVAAGRTARLRPGIESLCKFLIGRSLPVCSPLILFPDAEFSTLYQRHFDIRFAHRLQVLLRDVLVGNRFVYGRGGHNQRQATSAKFAGITDDDRAPGGFRHCAVYACLQKIWRGQSIANVKPVHSQEEEV